MNKYYAVHVHAIRYDEDERTGTVLWTNDDDRAEWYEMVRHVDLDTAWEIVEALTMREDARRERVPAEVGRRRGRRWRGDGGAS